MSYNYQDDPLWQALESNWLGLEFGRHSMTSPEQLIEQVVTALIEERRETDLLVRALLSVLSFLEKDVCGGGAVNYEMGEMQDRRLHDLIELLGDSNRADILRKIDAIYD